MLRAMGIAEDRDAARKWLFLFSALQFMFLKLWEFLCPRDDNYWLATLPPLVFIVIFAFVNVGVKYTHQHDGRNTTEVACDLECIKFPHVCTEQTFRNGNNCCTLLWPVVSKLAGSIALISPIFANWAEDSLETAILEVFGAIFFFISEAVDCSDYDD